MGDVPTTGQLTLLAAAILVFVAGAALALARFWFDRPAVRIGAKACLYAGTAMGVAVIMWHAVLRHSWQPLDDNFDTLIWLAVLLALFVAYTQRTHPLRGLDSFVLPIVVLMLVLAAVFGRARPHEYREETVWMTVHRITAYGGSVAFAVAAAVGVMYLRAVSLLRQKKLTPGHGFASLERLEHLTFASVTLGFALLTVGLVTGLVRALAMHGNNSLGPEWYRAPKVLLAFVAWIVYALVLHSPINPSFRGKRAAMLSVVGFVLMIGTFVAVQFMPSR
jgi:ABC-type uncharacterized transport system permease subunit